MVLSSAYILMKTLFHKGMSIEKIQYVNASFISTWKYEDHTINFMPKLTGVK